MAALLLLYLFLHYIHFSLIERTLSPCLVIICHLIPKRRDCQRTLAGNPGITATTLSVPDERNLAKLTASSIAIDCTSWHT